MFWAYISRPLIANQGSIIDSVDVSGLEECKNICSLNDFCTSIIYTGPEIPTGKDDPECHLQALCVSQSDKSHFAVWAEAYRTFYVECGNSNNLYESINTQWKIK